MKKMSSGFADSGDWTCSDNDCRHVNFGRRSQCHKCHRDRSVERVSSGGGGGGSSGVGVGAGVGAGPGTGSSVSSGGGGGGGLVKKKLGTEIGKAAAEKSRGLFSAEDWQCSKCANVNWARRQTCNMCNAPKFCDVEERTGYGGGYNDRGIVEYKERPESDSEYDEFGRLKKRRNKDEKSKDNKSRGLIENEKKEVEVACNEEDDEEEDDDEGGDLSKYDLWGDDDIAAIVPVKSTNDSGQKQKKEPNAKQSTITSASAIKRKGSRSLTRSHTRSRTRSRSHSGSVSSSSSTSTTSSSSTSDTSTSHSGSSSGRSQSSSRSRSQSRGYKSTRYGSKSLREHRRSRERSKTHSQHSHSSSHKSSHQENHISKSRSRSRSRSPSRTSSHSSSSSAKKNRHRR